MKNLRDCPGLTVLVSRARPFVVSTSWLVSLGHAEGEEPRLLVARTPLPLRSHYPTRPLATRIGYMLFEV